MVLQLAVDGNENVKPVLSLGQHKRVAAAAPSHLGYRLDSVAAKSRLDPGINTFV